MAEEEVKEEVKKEAESSFDEAKIAELIKSNVNTSMREAISNLQANQPKVQEEVKPDYWDEIVNPRIDAKVGQSNLKAESAEDKIDFYSSDDWLEEAEQWLTEEDPIKRKAEKLGLRTEIEKTFDNLIKSGRGTKRGDIFSYVLGEKIKKDRVKYQESMGKKASKSKEDELNKARRGVDISSGNISNFTASEIHSMSYEKIVEKFGEVSF